MTSVRTRANDKPGLTATGAMAEKWILWLMARGVTMADEIEWARVLVRRID